MIKYLVGHVIDVLKTMDPESVHCVVTSPPYWGLRKYEGEQEVVWGGDPKCQHEWDTITFRKRGHAGDKSTLAGTQTADLSKSVGGTETNLCSKCGAWRGALGLEPTPEMYVQHLVEVFRELRRVLRKDGTVWLNLGDSYAGYWGDKYAHKPFGEDRTPDATTPPNKPSMDFSHGPIKPKDLLGMPWSVAFALRADGWWLRSDIIWSKLNPMTEPVTDRPTKSHEYVFLLTKSGKYYYDGEAIREPATRERSGNVARKENLQPTRSGRHFGRSVPWKNKGQGRNKRTVWGTIWEITTHAFPDAHFAVYPEALVEPCIKAGCPKDGIVLDPFAGAGTTLLVARRLLRDAIGIDICEAYQRMAIRRGGVTVSSLEEFTEKERSDV